MIIGEYRSKIGVKKRVAIPAKIREGLSDEIILTRGYEGSLVLVDKKMWSNIASEVIEGSFINKSIRETSRFLVGSAVELEPDKQGRVVIPQALFEHANIGTSKELVFIGLINWVEIWSIENWESKIKEVSENSEKISEELIKSSNE